MPESKPAAAAQDGHGAGVAFLLLALANLLWAGNNVVGRAVAELISPVALSFLRWVLAAAILAPFLARPIWQHRALIRREWKVLLLLGATGIGAFHTFLYTGLAGTQAINAGLLLAATPVMIVLFTWVLFREPVTMRQRAGIGLGLVGVAWLVSRGDPLALAALDLRPGDGWVIAAAATWALYSALLRLKPAGLPHFAFLGVTIVVGLAVLTPLFVAEQVVGTAFVPSQGAILAIVFVALFPSILSYLAWNRGTVAVGANVAGLFMNLNPVFTAMLAILFLDEPLQGFHLIAFAAILGGLLLATRRGRETAA